MHRVLRNQDAAFKPLWPWLITDTVVSVTFSWPEQVTGPAQTPLLDGSSYEVTLQSMRAQEGQTVVTIFVTDLSQSLYD